MLVAELSLSAIIRWTTSRRGSCTPSESSLPMMPLPDTLSRAVMVRGSVHLALPAVTWSKTASRMGSLMVLAVRTGSACRIPTLSPVSRFLAYSETVPWKSPMRARRASCKDWAGKAAAKTRARAADVRMELMIPCGAVTGLRVRLDFERCDLTRRRGDAEENAENTQEVGRWLPFRQRKVKNLRARRQRRSHGFAAKRTQGWKADSYFLGSGFTVNTRVYVWPSTVSFTV